MSYGNLPIIGGTDVVTFRDPISRNPRSYKWWAARGLIHWEREDGEYGTQTVRTTLERLKGIQDMLGNTIGSKDKGAFRSDDVHAYQNYIDDMIRVCQKARDQGMPDNPQHAAQKTEAARAKRQSRTFVVPGPNSRF